MRRRVGHLAAFVACKQIDGIKVVADADLDANKPAMSAQRGNHACVTGRR